VFSLPWFALATGLTLERLIAFRPKDPVQPRLIGLARDLAPVVGSAALLVPVSLYFETARIAAVLGDTPLRYTRAEHLAALLTYLAAYSTLLPSLAAKAAAVLAAHRKPAASLAENVRISTQVSDLFWAVIVAYVACTSLLPFSYERYVLVLLPLLMLTLVIDGATVFSLTRAETQRAGSRLLRGLLILAWLGSAAWLLPLRVAELRLHWVELAVPYRGPLDFAVEWIRREYARPEQLVIATNYEQPAIVYFLRSHVIVGIAGANLSQDLALQPDLIILRPWSHQRRALTELADRDRYQVVRFDVANLPYNNIPQLAPSRFVLVTHQFTTPLPGDPSSAFAILRRIPPAETKGP